MIIPIAAKGRRRLARTVAGAVLFATAGCASLGRAVFREPTVNVRQIVVRGLGLTGGSLDVMLSVYNPNRFSLDAVSMSYRVDIDSIPLGEGQLDGRFVVAEHDSSIVRVPIRFTYAGLGAAGRALLSAGTLRYRVRGELQVATPLGTFTRPYDQPGQYLMPSNR